MDHAVLGIDGKTLCKIGICSNSNVAQMQPPRPHSTGFIMLLLQYLNHICFVIIETMLKFFKIIGHHSSKV